MQKIPPNTKVVILAAGQSSRFFPFNTKHKSLTMVCSKPILAHTLESVKQAGFSEATIVVSNQQETESALKEFIPTDFQINYVLQPKPLGQANAMLRAIDQVDGQAFFINAQHFNFHQVVSHFDPYWQTQDIIGSSLRITTKTPKHYGIYKLEGDKVLGLQEKPSDTKVYSNQRSVGVYLLSKKFLTELKNSKTEEYQLEASIDRLSKTYTFHAYPVSQETPSLKHPWDLFKIKNIILENQTADISGKATIHATAIINGPVVIEAGAEVFEYAIVDGPAYIGKNAVVGRYSQIRSGSVLESGAQVQRSCDIRNSIIGQDTHVHSGFVGDSLVGSSCRIGAGFITSNRRFDREAVKIQVKDKQVSSSQNNLGAFIGSNTHVGIGVNTMPGTVIGPSSKIGPGVTIKGWFDSQSTITKSNV